MVLLADWRVSINSGPGTRGGKVQTLDWTTGMDYWTGILD